MLLVCFLPFLAVTALDLIDENEHRRGDLQRYVLDQQDLFSSSKFESLRDLLPNLIKEGHRILIFSSWTSCLDLLGCLMQHLHVKFQRMDGSCPSDERQRLIDQFNNDFSYSVFLLSTKACGLGINLTSADTCIIHDLDFNPFNDLQAEDRCHRIGQKKPVTVYKLITRDSVDEDIYKMQEKKVREREYRPLVVSSFGVIAQNLFLFQFGLYFCYQNATGKDECCHHGLFIVEKGKECNLEVRTTESRAEKYH